MFPRRENDTLASNQQIFVKQKRFWIQLAYNSENSIFFEV